MTHLLVCHNVVDFSKWKPARMMIILQPVKSCSFQEKIFAQCRSK